jgi:hypothetical protein
MIPPYDPSVDVRYAVLEGKLGLLASRNMNEPPEGPSGAAEFGPVLEDGVVPVPCVHWKSPPEVDQRPLQKLLVPEEKAQLWTGPLLVAEDVKVEETVGTMVAVALDEAVVEQVDEAVLVVVAEDVTVAVRVPVTVAELVAVGVGVDVPVERTHFCHTFRPDP